MNRIYRIVWSRVRNAWMVASELAKSHGKGGGTRASVLQPAEGDKVVTTVAANRAWPVTAAVLAALLAMQAPAHAADKYWDANRTSVNLGGSGTWDLTNTFWDSAGDGVSGPYAAWDNSAIDNAIFSGVAGTVTLGAPITAHNLVFNTSGYMLTGNTLTLAGSTPTIAVNAGTATVDSVLAGSGGLIKDGGGTLVLNGANTFSGDIAINGGRLTAGDDAALGAAGNDITTGAGTNVILDIRGDTDTARTVTIGDSGQLQLAGLSAGSAHISGNGNVYVAARDLVLSDGANDYTGTTTFRGCNGVCSFYFTSIGNIGEASSLGAPTDATAGTIYFNQSSQYSDNLVYLGDGDSSDRNWSINGAAAVIVNRGTGTLSLAGDIAGNGGTHFNAESADIALTGEISGNTSLILGGAPGHTTTLGGANSYTGVSAIQNITVVAPVLADTGVNSSFGTGSTINLADGTLSYTGATTTSDRTWAGQGAVAIRNDGTGSLTLSGPLSFVVGGVADTLTLGGSSAGTNTFSGEISGIGDLVADASGIWVLDGANTYTGSITVQNGTLRAGTAQAFGLSPVDATVNGGTLDLGGINTTFTSLSGTGGSVALGGATLTLDNTSGSSTYAGDITGSGGLVKRGASTQVLSGANTYTGATTIFGGTLGLDFAAAGGPTANIISDLSTLTMAGGSLLVTGADGETNTQAFNGVDIAGGNNNISAVSGSGGSTVLDLGTINRSAGMIDFDLPTDGFIGTTSTALGGWATINNGSDYATVVGGHIEALAPEDYTVQDDPSQWLDGQIITDDADGFTADIVNAPGGMLQLAGLRYTAPKSTTLNIAAGDTLGIDGNILVTPTVLDNNQTITGGSLTGPTGGGSLGIQQNSDGNVLIYSRITDNSGAIDFVKGGTGEVTLYNTASNYTGATIISGGTLYVGSIGNGGAASAIGASTADASNLVLQNGTLRYGGATATTDRGFTLLNGGPQRTIQIDGGTDLAFTGLVTSPDDAGFTKTGAGTLTLANAGNDYVGVTTIAGGMLSVGTLSDGGSASGIGAAGNSSANLILENDGRLQYTGGSTGIDRGFTLDGGNGRIDVAQAATTLTIGGNAVGIGRLVKDGAGTLVLTGTNAYTGDTIVAAGTLRAGSASAFGPPDNYMTVNNGAVLELGGFDISAGALVGDGTVDLGANTFTSAQGPGTFSGTITGTGGFTRGAGSYTQVLSGCNNDYTGATTIASGLSIDCIADGGQNSSIGASTADAANLVFNGGGLTYTGGSVATNRGFTLASGIGAISVAQAGTTLEFSGEVIGGGSLNKVGDGTLVLSGDNTYAGTTYLGGGVLRAGSITAFGGTGALRMDGIGSTLDLDGFDNTVSTIAEYSTAVGDITRRITLGGATLTVGGANGSYSGTITGPGNLVKTASGTQTLAGCTSDYSGTTTISGGALAVACLGDGGEASSIGSSSADAANLVLDGGTLAYVGDGDSTDRQFTLGDAVSSTLTASGDGAIDFTSTAPIMFEGTTARTLVLRGTSSGDNTLSAQIDDASASGVTRITKADASTWILANDGNRYTGVTTISGGVLGVSKLADGGQASSIGMSSNVAANLVIGNGSTLRYTGAGDSTDRLFTLAQGVTFIESAGSGAIQFTNTGSATLSGGGARTIALGGSNTGNNIMGGTIADASASGKTTLAKNDSGTWILTGDNTYTGNTVINDGNLMIGNGGTTGNAGAGNVIVDAGTSTLSINRSDAFDFDGTLSGPGALAQIGTGTTRLTAVDNAIGATSIDAGTLQIDSGGSLASATIAINGTSTLDVRGTVEGSDGDAATLTGDAGASTVRIAAGGSLVAGGDLGGGSDLLDISGTFDTGTGGFGLGAGADTVVLNDGATVNGSGVDAGTDADTDTLQINNAAAFTFDGSGFSGFEQLSKHDAGVLTLTGTQAYVEGTEVTEGTLDVDGELETGTITMADDTTLNVDGSVHGADGAPTTIFGSAGINTVLVNAGASMVAEGDLGDGDDAVDLAGSLDTGTGLSLGAGNDSFTLHDDAVLAGVGVDAGTGTGDELVLDSDTALAFDGGKSTGFELLSKQGAGTATMTGEQDFDATFVDAGMLAIDGTLGTDLLLLDAGTTLAVDGTVHASDGSQTSISGDAGVNTVTVGTGGTLLASGSLGDGDDIVTLAGQLDTGTGDTLDLGGGADSVTLADGAAIAGMGIDAGSGDDTLVLDSADDLAFDGSATSDFETLRKQNTGTATMTGTQSFTVATTLVGGTLAVAGTLRTPTLSLSDDTEFDVDGTVEADGGGAAAIAGSAGSNAVKVGSDGTLRATGDLGDGADTLDVAGVLDTGAGTFSLGAGDDSFVIHDGTQILGTVDGGAGNDTGVYDIDLVADIGALTGFEALDKTGTGTLNINGPADSDIRTVQVSEGTLNVGAGGAIADVTDTSVATGATLNVDGSYAGSATGDSFTVAGTVEGSGSIDLGDGDDVLTLQDGAALGIAIHGGGAAGDRVVLDNAAGMSFDGSFVDGFEQLVKQNTGTATLAGTHAYDETHLDNGTLAVTSTLDSSTIDMADGTTLEVFGTVQGNGTPSTTITGSAGNNVVRVADGAALFASGDLGDGDDELDVAGTLNTGAGEFSLGAGNDTFTLHNTTVVIGTLDAGDGIDTLNVTVDDGYLVPLDSTIGFESLGKSGDGGLQINGASGFDEVQVHGGLLDVTTTGSIATGSATVDAGATLNVDGTFGFTADDDSFTVAGNVEGDGSINMLGGDDTLTLLDGADLGGLATSIDGGAGDDLIDADIATSATLGGVTGFEILDKSGAGTLHINGPAGSSFGTVNVLGGRLDVGAAANITDVSATTVAAGATLNVDGSYAGSAGDDSFVLDGTLDGSGSVDLGAGDDTLTMRDGAILGATVDGGTGAADEVVLDNTNAFTLDGANLSGFEQLTKQNDGTATLDGAHVYEDVVIDGGTLEVAQSLAADTVAMADDTTLDIAGTLQSNSGAQAVITGSAGANTVVVDSGATAFANGDLGDGEDTLDVIGTLDTGGGTFSLGGGDDTLVVHDGTNIIGTIDGGAGNDTRVYDITGTASIGALQGFESLTKRNTGTLHFTGPATSNLSDVAVEGGTLDIQGTSSFVDVRTTSVLAGATLNIDGDYSGSVDNDSFTVAGTVSGSGRVDLGDGDDTLTIQDGAVFDIAIDGGTGGIDGVVLDNADDLAFDGTNVTGFENLAKQNTGTATLIGNHAYFDTAVDGGTLKVDGDLQTDGLELADGAALDIDGTVQASGGAAVALAGDAGDSTIRVGAGASLVASGDLGAGDDALDITGQLDTGSGALSLGAGDDTFTVHDGTVINGIVAGGDGTDTSVYDIDTTAGIGAFTGFERLSKIGDGVLEVRGPADSDVTEVEVLGGTLDVTAGGSIGSVTKATVGSGATLAIEGGFSFTDGDDTFDVAGTVSSTGALDMLDGDDTLILHDGADLSGLASPIDGGAGTDALIADIDTSASLGGAVGFETLTKDGAGSLAVTGPASAAFESVQVRNGTLDVAAAGQLVTQQAGVDAGAELHVDGSLDFGAGDDILEVAGTVSGNGTIDMLDGDDTLILHDGADLSALATAIDGGAGNDTLTADIASQATLGGATGFENLVKQGEGRFTIAGPADSQFGSVQIHQGELEIAAGAVVDPETTVVDEDATLTVDGSYLGTTGDDSFDLSGTLAGEGSIDLLDGDDVLTINTGAVIDFIGTFDASGQDGEDSFVLAGDGEESFEAGLIGTVFTGFEAFLKEGTGTWTLAGTGSNDWTVVEGSLVGDSDGFGGDIDIGTAGTVVFDQAADGSYDHRISGDGTLVKRNAGTLVFSGDHGFSGSTRIEAGGLQVDGSLPGDLVIASGAILSGTGMVGRVSAPAGSFVDPGNAAYPFGTLTVAGDFAGGGTVRINTVLGDEHSDTGRLVVQGDVSGRSALLVNPWSGDGAMTEGDGIQVVQVDGESADDSFRLAAPVQAGAYEYLLYQGGDKDDNDWYLRSELIDGSDAGNGGNDDNGGGEPPVPAPAFRYGVPGYVLGHQLNLEYGFSVLGDLRSRVGDQGRITTEDGRQKPADFWARMYAHDLDIDGTRFSAHDVQMFATQFGMDVHSTVEGDASTHFGLMASIGGSRAALSDNERARAGERGLAGRMETKTKGIGTYWTYFGANGGYIDLAGQLLHYRNQYRDAVLDAGHQSGWGGTASVEVGISSAMGNSGWFVQPELQVAYQHLSLGHFIDNISDVEEINDNALRARAEVRFARAPKSWLGMGNASPYVGVGVQRDYRDAVAVTVGGTTLNDAIPDTSGDLSVGFTGDLAKGVELHFDTRYQKSTHGRRDGVRANLGVRVAL